MKQDEEYKFYTGKSDRAFKEIMLKEGNEELLKLILEKILKLKINSIEINNIELLTGNIHTRKKSVDVLLTTNVGKIEVEVNACNKDYVRPRNMAYISDIYSHNTLVGESYDITTKIIQINLSYGLDDEKELRVYRVQDEENKLFVNNLIIYEVNMEYYMKMWYDKDKKGIDENKYLIMLDLKKEELDRLSQKDKVVHRYMDDLVELNKKPEFRQYMSEEEDKRKIQNSLINQARREGIASNKLENTINLLKANDDVETISKGIGLSVEEIIRIAEENNIPYRHEWEYMSEEEDKRKIQNSLINQARREGIASTKLENTINFLKANDDVETISKGIGISVEEVIKIAEENGIPYRYKLEKDVTKVDIAKKMLNDGIDIETIAKYCDLTLDELNKL